VTLLKVTVGRDEYLGTAEEVVAWMSRAVGAPGRGEGDLVGFMEGVRARLGERGKRAGIDASSPAASLASLAAGGFVRMEERREASRDREDPREAIGEGPVAFGEGVDADDVLGDVLGPLGEPADGEPEEEEGDGGRAGAR
jgi:hypothetical protein